MGRTICAMLLIISISACAEKKVPVMRRAEIRKLQGDVIEIVPTAGQFPYCLVFTTAGSGVTRQLTITPWNKSVRCESGVPIGKTSYRIPVEEGPVKVHIFFSDQPLDATWVAIQIADSVGTPDFKPMNLRLPGRVASQTLDFAPSVEPAPTVGTLVDGDRDSRNHQIDADGGRTKPAL